MNNYNPVKNKEYKRKYRKKNLERVLLLEKLARDRHKEKRIAYYKEYKEKNKELLFKKRKEWIRKNPEYIQSMVLKRYNLTIDEYNKMLKKQSNQCAICLKPQISVKRRFAVDHCHKTGINRGLLCYKCNIGLGYFDDNILKLQYAIYYLKQFMV